MDRHAIRTGHRGACPDGGAAGRSVAGTNVAGSGIGCFGQGRIGPALDATPFAAGVLKTTLVFVGLRPTGECGFGQTNQACHGRVRNRTRPFFVGRLPQMYVG